VVFVAALPGQQLDVKELKEFIALRIHEPPAKPRQVFVVDEIPVTAVGKVFKPELRDLAVKHKLRDVVAAFGEQVEFVEAVAKEGAYESYEVRVREVSGRCTDDTLKTLERVLAELPLSAELRWQASSVRD
jgi:fatty-acyl-CoA synthase